MYIFIIITILLIALFFIPMRLEFNFNIKSVPHKSSKKSVIQGKSDFIKLKIFYFIPILKLNINKNKKKNKDKQKSGVNNEKNNGKDAKSNHYILDTIYSLFIELLGYSKMKKSLIKRKEFSRLLNNIKYEKFDLNFGFNFEDPIINSYIMASVNTLLCIYINKNIERFNLSNLYYNSYICKPIYKFNFYSIMKFKLADNISILLCVIYRYFKIKFNIKKRKVENKNGRKTSDRKSYDDSNDISRKYD